MRSVCCAVSLGYGVAGGALRFGMPRVREKGQWTSRAGVDRLVDQARLDFLLPLWDLG
jgi:hypothetical protein